MSPVKRVKFLLVFVDAFSRQIEAFPTTNKRAPTVAQLILTEILPRFEMTSYLGLSISHQQKTYSPR